MNSNVNSVVIVGGKKTGKKTFGEHLLAKIVEYAESSEYIAREAVLKHGWSDDMEEPGTVTIYVLTAKDIINDECLSIVKQQCKDKSTCVVTIESNRKSVELRPGSEESNEDGPFISKSIWASWKDLAEFSVVNNFPQDNGVRMSQCVTAVAQHVMKL